MTELSHTTRVGPRRRLLVIVNGLAARTRARQLAASLAALRDLGCAIEERHTAAAGDALRLARAARQSDADAIVVAGGDGTINEVINGLLDGGGLLEDGTPAGARPPHSLPPRPLPPLAVIPLGTANVLAAEIGLGIGLDPRRVAEAIVSGPVRAVSLGRVEGDDRNSARAFTLMAGAGFDAHVVAQLDLGLKARFKKGAYVWETLRQLRRFPFPRYRVTLDGREYEVASVVAANARFYGGRFVIAPDARLERPDFEVVCFKRPGAWNALRYALALGRGRLDRLANAKGHDVEIVTGRRLTIEGPDGDPLQGDGDVIARLPVTLTVVPQALALVVPADGRLGRGALSRDG